MNARSLKLIALCLCAFLLHAGAATGKCDRSSLCGFVDQYLSALVAHDSSRLPLSKHVKFTENGQRLELGDGLWNTASARGAYKLYVADPRAGQIGYFGTILENGVPAILTLRLKVENRKITEIETLVARGDASGSHGERGARNLEKMGAPHPVFLADIPVSERASRENLIRTANMYFTGLERNDGKGVYPFTEDCQRIEEGKIRQVEAVLDQCPYGMNSGWSSWKDGLSSRPR